MRPAALLAAVFAVLLPMTTSTARTWHIQPDGSGDAPTIQAGIDLSVVGDTVLLASGTYHDCTHVDGEGLRCCAVLKEGVSLRGETGDPSSVRIDAEQLGRCLYIEYATQTIIEGITLTGGYAAGVYGQKDGAGLLAVTSSVRVRDCVFTENHADHTGGGVALIYNLSSQFENCQFLSNSCSSDGGGLYALGTDAPLRTCQFTGNTAKSGGGLFCEDGTSMLVEDCVFEGNEATDGGGVYVWYASPSFRNCVFRENAADVHGGALHGNLPNYDDGTDTSLEDCLVVGNAAGGDGGGLFCRSGADLYVNNCTMVGNMSSTEGGGLASGSSSIAFVTNTIIAYGAGGAAAACVGVGAMISIDCSDVFGNANGDWVGCIASQAGADGNFSANPRFCGAPTGDFTLRSDSPCLPGEHPDGYDCGLVGAFGEGCSAPTSVEQGTWGGIKAMWR